MNLISTFARLKISLTVCFVSPATPERPHKPHNASAPCPTMRHSEQKYTYTVLNGVLWDLWDWSTHVFCMSFRAWYYSEKQEAMVPHLIRAKWHTYAEVNYGSSLVKKRHVAPWVGGHLLNHCWLILDQTSRNRFQWNFNWILMRNFVSYLTYNRCYASTLCHSLSNPHRRPKFA